MSEEYECALSGEVGESEDGDLPMGWTTITIERKLPNQRYVEIQQAKAALTEAALQQMPDEVRDQMRWLIGLQIDAQFAELENQTDAFETATEIVYVSSPERDGQVMNAYNDIRERLGLETLELPLADGEE
jgi:hypothetical protein